MKGRCVMKEPCILPFLWMRGEPESIIRQEMAKINECGIRAVCVEARPHDDFCGPGWWHDMDIVLDEARKRGMKVWILDDRHFPTGYANGLVQSKYPERGKQYLACTSADVFGPEHIVTLNVSRMLKPTIGFWEIGNPVNMEERAKNRLLALTALRFAEGGRFTEDAVDLTAYCREDGTASFTLPSGQWRVFALYLTRTDGGDESYLNMIDPMAGATQLEGVYEPHYERYGDEFGNTIAGFFSDEPQLGNIREVCYDGKLGKWKMPLPWTDELAQMLKERSRDDYPSLLPFLFVESARGIKGPQMRFDYMDCVSRLYAKNFCCPVGDWCRAHGVEYIGHVVEDNSVHSRLGMGAAHWFRAMEGQDMAGIDVIGGQYYFGAPAQERLAMLPSDGEFYHYTLGRLGSSGGHLDPKKKGRTVCELFGAYGWGFGVREMKHLLDHLLSRGVNRLVPHAFSMADYPDPECPPHFYARGHNPEFPYFAELMRYADRMCAQLSDGQHIASAAVLYDGELDWPGSRMPMQKICRVLTQTQISFDIVCMDMLRDLPAFNGGLSEKTLSINGVQFGALLIPGADYVPASLLSMAGSAPEFPVFFVGSHPKGFLRDDAAEDASDAFTIPVLAPDDIPSALEQRGLRPVQVTPAFSELSVYMYHRPDGRRYFLLNESPDRSFAGTIRLPAARPLVRYDGFTDGCESLNCVLQDGAAVLQIQLEPGESFLVMESGDSVLLPCHCFARELAENCGDTLPLSDGWHICCVDVQGQTVLEETRDSLLPLVPISDRLPAFSGTIVYETEFFLDQIPETVLFYAEHVYDVMRLSVNGKDAGCCLTPPWQIEVSGLVQTGVNTLRVEVATTPARDQQNYPSPPFDFSIEPVEPTGMFGIVELRKPQM